MSLKAVSGGTVWLNGRFLPLESACVSVLDRGFLYGDGCFETIRAQGGRPLFLRRHLERLYSSLSAFRIGLNSLPEWPGILEALLHGNKLDRDVAAIKIIVTRGTASHMGMPVQEHPTVLVHARRYDLPTPDAYEDGISLHIFDEGYTPPLAFHKSLNYLYCLAARQAALDNGAGDAVLLDKEGRVAETSSGSLLASTNGEWWTPQTNYCLHGITVREVSSILAESGTGVEAREAAPCDLMAAETVWVLNSLMGIMPVARIGAHRIAHPRASEAARCRNLLFERGLKA